jgi:hypothetical protein
MDNAWTVATSYAYSQAHKSEMVKMWLGIASLELQEPVKKDKQDSFNWAPPSEKDPSVVGTRCAECRHFEDNHSDSDGCRECGCEWVTRVAG